MRDDEVSMSPKRRSSTRHTASMTQMHMVRLLCVVECFLFLTCYFSGRFGLAHANLVSIGKAPKSQTKGGQDWVLNTARCDTPLLEPVQ